MSANVYTRGSYVENSATGTSTNDVTAIATIDGRDSKFVTVYIKNTGGTNTLSYKIDKYAKYSGSISQEAVAATDIAAGAVATFTAEDKLVAKYVVSIESKVDGSHSTYSIEYIKG